MERSTRIVITVVSVIFVSAVLGALAIIGLTVWMVSQYSQEDMANAEVQGQASGRGATTDRCVELALARADGCGPIDPVCLTNATLFLRSCLDEAELTAGFCDGVPPPSAVMRGSDWIMMYCARHDRPDDQGCIAVVGEIQLYCSDVGGEPSHP